MPQKDRRSHRMREKRAAKELDAKRRKGNAKFWEQVKKDKAEFEIYKKEFLEKKYGKSTENNEGIKSNEKPKLSPETEEAWKNYKSREATAPAARNKSKSSNEDILNDLNNSRVERSTKTQKLNENNPNEDPFNYKNEDLVEINLNPREELPVAYPRVREPTGATVGNYGGLKTKMENFGAGAIESLASGAEFQLIMDELPGGLQVQEFVGQQFASIWNKVPNGEEKGSVEKYLGGAMGAMGNVTDYLVEPIERHMSELSGGYFTNAAGNRLNANKENVQLTEQILKDGGLDFVNKYGATGFVDKMSRIFAPGSYAKLEKVYTHQKDLNIDADSRQTLNDFGI